MGLACLPGKDVHYLLLNVFETINLVSVILDKLSYPLRDFWEPHSIKNGGLYEKVKTK